jgi:anaerobic ribonucleoside-triphosphate reductase activating protein
MLIHSKIESSTVNGPGNRAVIWVAGCTLDCQGCWNPDTHAFDARKETSVEKIQEWLLSLKDIDGVTLSGGEPMQHAADLYILMHWIKNNTNLTIGMFTGYSQKELNEGRWKWHSRATGDFRQGSKEIWEAIKGMLDFAIMGRYNQLVSCSDKPLCGSRNQEVVFFTDKYSEKDLTQQEIEIQISTEGLVQLTGFPVGISMDEENDNLVSA